MKKSIPSIIAILLIVTILLASCTNSTESNNTSSNSIMADNNSSTSDNEELNGSNSNTSETTTSIETVSDVTSSDETSSIESEDSEANMSQDESEPDTSSSNENSFDITSEETSDSSSVKNETSNVSHKHSYKKTVVNPTCTEKGYTKNVCSCGDSYISDEKPTVEHNVVYSNMTEPTETTRGKYIYKCSYGCGQTVVEEIYSYNEYAELLVPYVLQSINEYRAKEGAPAVKLSNQLTKFSQYRSKQLLSNFNHSMTDSDTAAEATHVGVYYSDYVDPIDNVFVPAHWCAQYYGEVIQKGYIQSNQTVKSGKALQDDLEKAANAIIQAFWNSQAHKDILAEKTDFQIHVGIGVYKGYVCINLSIANQDETGYQHYWYDNEFLTNGGKFHLCEEYVKNGNPQFKCIDPNHHK